MPGECIVTTSWDDGSRLDLNLAGLMAKYDIRGTFYIPKQYRTDALGEREIQALGLRFEIGAHTLTHATLTAIPLEQARKEIVESKRYLEQVAGPPVAMFCYPKGRFNESVKEVVRQSGFLAARTIDFGSFELPADPFAWPITLHASNGSPRMILRTCLRSGISVRALLDWEVRAMLLFDLACKKGGVYHLWGHSWEINRNRDWQKLERVFKYISRREGVSYLSNGEIFAKSWR